MVSSEIIKDDFAIIGGRGDEDREKKGHDQQIWRIWRVRILQSERFLPKSLDFADKSVNVGLKIRIRPHPNFGTPMNF
jgi:hypothetical protein